MKKTSIILTLAAMLVAMVSCTKEKLPVSGKFTMTVNADKGTRTTKNLSLDGNTLNALWEAGESVTVTKGEVCLGFLYAVSDGTSTTLTGTIEGEIAENDILTLEFLSEFYDQQEGTLEFIATHSDYAKAEVRITSISGGSVTTTDAVFANQQAIVKFTLQTMSGVNLSASQLVVSVDGTDYTVDPDNDINVLYVALPGFSNKDVTLTATVVVEGEEEDTEYEYTKTVSNVTFANGQYYTITARLGKIIELSSLSGNYEAQNGDILTGTLAGNYKISVADGATVTLRDATITCLGETTDFAGITCPGNATIVLEGTNNVIGGGGTENVHRNPGIYIAPNYTLTIQGSGTLNVSSNTSANSGVGAGIGGAWANSDAGNCGNIVINGGTINATGGYGCAGIGAGYGRTCQNITIAGGSVTATGGTNAAGIGSGFSGYGSNSSCGDISISDGTVNASGGSHATGIGTGYANGATNNTCGLLASAEEP